MELDKRIEKLSDVLTCVSVEEAKQFIGQKGYFTDFIGKYQNLASRCYGALTAIRDDGDYAFKCEVAADYWRYFIPECRLKPEVKKCRPYTIEEFCNEGFEIVVFREKNNPAMEYHVRYNGYRKYNNVYNVILGNIAYTFNDLFTDFEYLDSDDNWKPFGVEE